MPKISIFTPCGQLRCSSEPSLVEQYYRLLPQMWGTEIDFTQVGSDDEAKLYAVARMCALMHVELKHAGNQANPNTALDLLPLLENDFLVTPGPNDTVPTRQKAVAAAMLLTRGAIASNVVNLLRAIAGANFLAYVPAPAGLSPTVHPTSPGTGPGAFKDVRQPAKVLQLVDPVVATGSPSWVAYQALDTSAVPTEVWSANTNFAAGQQLIPTAANSVGAFFICQSPGISGASEPTWNPAPGSTTNDGTVVWSCVAAIAPALVTGDVIVVDPGNTLRMEKCTVSAVSNTAPAGQNVTPGYLYAQVTFSSAHDTGAPMTTGQAPYWWSTQRFNWIVLQAAAAVDAPTRSKIDNFLAKVLRGVDTWATLQPATTTQTGGTVGPLSAGQPIGAVPVGSFTFSNSN